MGRRSEIAGGVASAHLDARRKRCLLAALSILVVFFTAIALMLPAISMTKGDLVCGYEEHTHSASCYEYVLVCGQDEVAATDEDEGHQHSDACYEKRLVCDVPEHEHTINCYAQEEPEPEPEPVADSLPQDDFQTVEPEGNNQIDESQPPGDLAPGVEYPAQDFVGTVENDKGNVIFVAQVRAPEGAFPEGTTMAVELVDATKVTKRVKAAISYDSNLAGKVKSDQIIAAKLTFTKADGAKVDPLAPVLVKLTALDIRNFDSPALVHVLNEKKATKAGKLDADGNPMKAEMVGQFAVVNQDEDNKTKGTEDTLKFEADDSGTYAIINLVAVEPGDTADPDEATDPDETVDPDEADPDEPDGADSDDPAEQRFITTEDNPEPEPPALPAQSFGQELAVDGVALTVDVEAPEGALPEGATMKVAPVTQKRVLTAAVKKAASETDITQSHAEALAVDITFYDAEGNPIEPQADVHVSMRAPDIAPTIAAQGDMAIVHVDDNMKAKVVSAADVNPETASAEFDSADFSVYAMVYTVDFGWEVNGKTYHFNMLGGSHVSLSALMEALGVANQDAATTDPADELDAQTLEGTQASERTVAFVEDVASVQFSNPSLVWVGKVDADTTVGDLKAANNLECQYSAGLTVTQIAEMNAAEVKAGDWAIISLVPFSSEETLTITMKNGDVFTVKVKDGHEIPDAASTTIDPTKSYLIYYQVGEGENAQYYLLKNNGSVDASKTPADFENLNSAYCWSFNYVFEEKHLEDTLTYVYYLIRPIDKKTHTIALNAEGQPLIQQSNNNVAVIPVEGGGFKLLGYNDVKLAFEDGTFLAKASTEQNPFDGATIHIFEMDVLPTYSYTARSSDESRGAVTIAGGTAKSDDDGNYYEAESTSDKKNAGAITAVPVTHVDGGGNNKWLFDHWTLDGIPLDRQQYGQTIAAGALDITHNETKLVAYFRQNSAYNVPPEEKQASSFDDMSDWLDKLTSTPVPLEEGATKKTAEVYDYENRIYRVDIESHANFRTFNGNVDMAFCMDVSNSMRFPSKLDPATTSGANPMRIYQINNNNQTKQWLDQSRDWNNPYYLIADQAGTATVFKVYYQNGNWKAQDASRTTESDKSFRIGDEFETTWTGGSSATDKRHPFGAGDNDNTTYTIYNAGDNGNNRFYYLNQSFQGANSDLAAIRDLLHVAGAESPQVRVAYNTFNKEREESHDFQAVAPINTPTLDNHAGGGTRPDQAFTDAKNFSWSGNSRYVILITDGAPQGYRMNGNQYIDDISTPQQIYDAVRNTAQDLKNTRNVKFITVGLSLDKVPSGKQLLYDLADTDSDGDKMFYMAESASDLPNILRQIVDTVMDDAVVLSDVTDTVGDAFYIVDKETGLPLQPGDMINIDGQKVTNASEAAGVVLEDGVTVKWTDAAIDPQNGWHGTLYAKAKEDLLGGNAVETNKDASVKATKYRMDSGTYSFDESEIGDKLKSLEVEFDQSPRVNVNELSFSKESSEWTVYLGTDVDPAAQLKQMYEDISVTQVVNEDGTLHYALEPNSIVDNRTGDEDGTAKTFPLAPLILELIKADPDLAAAYVEDGELKWDAFLDAIQQPNGVVVPYHEYGIQGDDSNIVITLTKEVLPGEQDDLVNHSPHATTVVNGVGDEGESVPAEKYTLVVQYNPDYDHVLPAGQGGKHPETAPNYHTGTFGSMYQGHAAGRETSTNVHVVNVYVKTLDVVKTDDGSPANMLGGATFKLYERDDESPDAVNVAGLTGKYIEVASGTSPESGQNKGIANLAFTGNHVGLKCGVMYYLVEIQAPEGFLRDDSVWTVTVQTDAGEFTNLDGEPIEGMIYPFNWSQGARVLVDNQPVKIIEPGETEGTTVEVDGGPYVADKDAISFRHTVVNKKNEIGITVDKTWENVSDPPNSIQFQLYRVSDKGHEWGDATITPSTCTEEGVKHYECKHCDATRDVAISPLGHTPGAPVEENQVPAKCEEAGSYDLVTYCSVCGAELSRETKTIPMTGHAWGPWVVTLEPQPGVPGEKRRECANDPSHSETEEIPALPNLTSITYRTYNDFFQLAWRRDTVTPTQQYPIGSSITLTWSSNAEYTTTVYVNGTATEQTAFGFTLYSLSGTTAPVTRTGNRPYTYSVTVTVTENMVLDMKSSVFLEYPGNITITQNRSAQANTQSLRANAAAPKLAFPAKSGYGLMKGAEPTRAGEGRSTEPMTQEQVQAYLDSIQSKDDAICAETPGADHTYKEPVGTFTITKNDQGQWTWSKDDLPKYNEYGNEYAYYVLEAEMPAGYETTYTGQNEGLHDDSTVTINNKLTKGSLLITKNVTYNGRAASTDAEKAQVNKTFTFTVTKEGETEGTTREIAITDGASGYVLIENLDVGDYTIEETGNGGLTLVSATGGKSVSGDNVVTATVRAGKTTVTDLEVDDIGHATFTNNYVEYEVIIVKTDTANNTLRLGGATFDLYGADSVEGGNLKPDATPLNAEPLVTSSEEGENKGKVSLGLLAAGTYYLKETQPPAGYNTLDELVTIQVAGGEVTLMQWGVAQTGNISQEKVEFTVMNTAGYELPHTGGVGVVVVYGLGALLVALAAGWLLRRRMFLSALSRHEFGVVTMSNE